MAYAYKSLGMSSYFEGNYLETVNYWQESLTLCEEIGDKTGVANLLSNLGGVNTSQGDDTRALELFLRSLNISEEINDTLRIVTALINIGLVYLKKPVTHDIALDYYLRAIPLSEKIGYDDAIGTASLNIGEIYLEMGDDSTALFYFEKSLKALEASGNIFYSLINIGKVYAKRQDYEKAISYQTEAYERAKKVDARLDMARSLLGLADTYQQMNNYSLAVKYFEDAKSLTEEIGANFELRDSFQGLADSYSKLGDFRKAYNYQLKLTDIKDTLFVKANEKKIELIHLNNDLDKKQSEIDLLTKDRALKELALQKQRAVKNTFLIALILILIIAFITFRNYMVKVKTNRLLDLQRMEIEKLVLNILPAKVAKELREDGHATSRYFKSVTVLFTDFKDFSKISEGLSPNELVAELNEFFNAFDNIIEKHFLEKIKTIGDAYMCVGGLPSINKTHPVNAVNAGLEMQQYMENVNKKRIEKGKTSWYLRVGIHTGPVTAGVVGRKKYAYDIWGSTVNVASRMESNGESGKVNVSSTTYELVKDKFECNYRGKISAKNIGEVDMYFIDQKKTLKQHNS